MPHLETPRLETGTRITVAYHSGREGYPINFLFLYFLGLGVAALISLANLAAL